MTDRKDIFKLMKLPECAESIFKPLPPPAQRLQAVLDEADSLKRKDDIERFLGERLAEQVQAEQEEIQLSIEREEFDRIEREEMARLSARAKWEASQQTAQAMPAPTQNTATPAPVVIDGIAFDMLATRQELIDAFGTFTDMDMSWFKNINDSRLKDARKFVGQGGRNNVEPLFCPYEVMKWLADPKCKKGRKLTNEKAWKLLKGYFPKVHNLYSIGDPNPD